MESVWAKLNVQSPIPRILKISSVNRAPIKIARFCVPDVETTAFHFEPKFLGLKLTSLNKLKLNRLPFFLREVYVILLPTYKKMQILMKLNMKSYVRVRMGYNTHTGVRERGAPTKFIYSSAHAHVKFLGIWKLKII